MDRVARLMRALPNGPGLPSVLALPPRPILPVVSFVILMLFPATLGKLKRKFNRAVSNRA
jgi:hypothetical protein